MRKILVLLIAVLLLFSFTSCEEGGNPKPIDSTSKSLLVSLATSTVAAIDAYIADPDYEPESSVEIALVLDNSDPEADYYYGSITYTLHPSENLDSLYLVECPVEITVNKSATDTIYSLTFNNCTMFGGDQLYNCSFKLYYIESTGIEYFSDVVVRIRHYEDFSYVV